MRLAILPALALLVSAPVAATPQGPPSGPQPTQSAEALPGPPMPASITQERRDTLGHGLRLANDGNLEFARGHFADALLPVPCRVQLVAAGVPRAQREAFLAAARAGIALWNRAFPGEVSFVEEQDPERSQAQVFFVPSVTGCNEKTGRAELVCGTTRVDAPHQGLRVPHYGTVLVAIYRPGVRVPWSPATITHVVAHELGHVIGIGESADPRCIMGPNSREPSVALADDDIKAARALLDYERALVARYGRPGAPQPGKPTATP